MKLDDVNKALLRRILKHPGIRTPDAIAPFLDQMSASQLRARVRWLADGGCIVREPVDHEFSLKPNLSNRDTLEELGHVEPQPKED